MHSKKKPLHQSILELEDHGLEVDIEHIRNVVIEIDSDGGKDEVEYINPRGGMTRAKILKDGNIVAFADAVCSPHDNYSKKLGALIALGRARKRLGV